MKADLTDQPVKLQVSVNWLKLISIVLACFGALLALRTSWAQLIHARDLCPLTNGMDCELVVRSVYSRVGPIPVVYLGLTGYLTLLGVRVAEARLPSGHFVTLGLTLFGLLFSAYLTIVQAFVLRTWCQPCELSALIITALFIMSSIRIWRLMIIDPVRVEADDEKA